MGFGLIFNIVALFALSVGASASETVDCQNHSLNISYIEKGFKVKEIPNFYLTKGMCLGELQSSSLKMDNFLWGATLGDDFSLQMYASRLLESNEPENVRLGLAIQGALSNSSKENIKINALTALGVYFSFSKEQYFPDEFSINEMREIGREYLLAAAESNFGFYAWYALSANSENVGKKFLSKGDEVQKTYLGSIQVSCDSYIEGLKNRSYLEHEMLKNGCQD